MPIRRITVNYEHALLATPCVSMWHFDSAVGTPADAAAAVMGFYTSIADRLHTGLVVRLDPEVTVFTTATGHPEAFEAVTSSTVTGTVGFEPLSPALQARLDLGTATVVNFRRLKGRIFIPMMTEGQSQGFPESGTVGDVNGSASALIGSSTVHWVVWSRTHGVGAQVTSAALWNKWAVLRSRRD